MHLTTVELQNWLPYKGVQTVDLEATCYAVIAKVEGAEGRSNWSGKTAFMESVAFALYGIHRKRTEDEWIYEDAKFGRVTLMFNNGVVVTRSRQRGEATKLVVTDGEDYSGDDAQDRINTIVGMTKQDFLNTCYFRQKDIARIVYAQPGERAKEFSSWFRLGALQGAEASTLARLNELRTEASETQEHLAGLALGIAQAVGEEVDTDMKVSEYIKTTFIRLQHKQERAKSRRTELELEYNDKVDAYSDAKASVDEWARHMRVVERYREVVAERKSLAVEVLDVSGELENAIGLYQGCASRQNLFVKEERRTRALLMGKFDGVCPVNGSDCPVRDDLINERDRNKDNHVAAQTTVSEGEQALKDAAHEVDALKRQDARGRNIAKRKAELDTVAAECKPSLKYINTHPEQPDIEDVRGEKQAAYEAFADADRFWRKLDEAVDTWQTGGTISEEGETTIQDIDREIAKLQAAAFIFGKQGAQRIIAERVLAGIVDGGNGKLNRCSIDLGFNITWAREGKGLADVCTGCGQPFPRSQRVKRCQRCDAERGRKLSEKSDILFSERSGAAEDIIGGVIRLEAGTWFRRDRGSQWGTLFVDEPFGALDEANRDAFCRLLLDTCTPKHGNTQAFIVAHHSDISSAMPGTITITRRDGASYVSTEVLR